MRRMVGPPPTCDTVAIYQSIDHCSNSADHNNIDDFDNHDDKHNNIDDFDNHHHGSAGNNDHQPERLPYHGRTDPFFVGHLDSNYRLGLRHDDVDRLPIHVGLDADVGLRRCRAILGSHSTH